jgi:hypothetical protein
VIVYLLLGLYAAGLAFDAAIERAKERAQLALAWLMSR